MKIFLAGRFRTVPLGVCKLLRNDLTNELIKFKGWLFFSGDRLYLVNLQMNVCLCLAGCQPVPPLQLCTIIFQVSRSFINEYNSAACWYLWEGCLCM